MNKAEYLKKWKAEKAITDPDYFKRASAKAYATRKELIENNPELKQEINRRSNQNSRARRIADPRKALLSEARKRAKRKGLACTINLEDITVPELCPVLGIKLFVGSGKRTSQSPSLDRIDNSKGYTRENVRVISYRANMIKNDATIDELRAIVQYMEDNNNGMVRNG